MKNNTGTKITYDQAMHDFGDAVSDIPVTVSVVLGRTVLSLEELMEKKSGNKFQINKMIDGPVDVHVNGDLFAKGSLVLLENKKLAVKITDIC